MWRCDMPSEGPAKMSSVGQQVRADEHFPCLPTTAAREPVFLPRACGGHAILRCRLHLPTATGDRISTTYVQSSTVTQPLLMANTRHADIHHHYHSMLHYYYHSSLVS